MQQELRQRQADLQTCTTILQTFYESRYVSGVVAGLKLNEMIEAGEITEDQAKMGYVGAFPYAEVIFRIYFFLSWRKERMPCSYYGSKIYKQLGKL